MIPSTHRGLALTHYSCAWLAHEAQAHDAAGASLAACYSGGGAIWGWEIRDIETGGQEAGFDSREGVPQSERRGAEEVFKQIQQSPILVTRAGVQQQWRIALPRIQ